VGEERERPVGAQDAELDLFRVTECGRVGSDEFAFLAVAYGLSHLAAEIPPAYSPDEFSEAEQSQRVAERLSHEDIYAR
jgi:hypothetical protein